MIALDENAVSLTEPPSWSTMPGDSGDFAMKSLSRSKT